MSGYLLFWYYTVADVYWNFCLNFYSLSSKIAPGEIEFKLHSNFLACKENNFIFGTFNFKCKVIDECAKDS